MPSVCVPRVVITGACRGLGRAFAAAFAGKAELILCDIDGPALSRLSETHGATGLFCDVAAEASVEVLASEILARWPQIDVLINAAGCNYERTLGMHGVSRALLPALRRSDGQRWILNVPPPKSEVRSEIFPYASSAEAFSRLSEALAQEVRGTGITVGIACPGLGDVEFVDGWSAMSPRVPANDEANHLETSAFADRICSAILSRAHG